ncbi:MAG: hypothetical protein AB7L09_01525 [Nitrospira sp.]
MGHGDPILDEMSYRCHRLLDTRVLIVERDVPSPFAEYRVGRVRMLRRDDYLAVFLDHLIYTFTDDMVFAERGKEHMYSSWPRIRDALLIVRMDMILDDLASF